MATQKTDPEEDAKAKTNAAAEKTVIKEAVNEEHLDQPEATQTEEASAEQIEEDPEKMSQKLPITEPAEEAKEAVEAIAADLNDENPDKVDEYFTTKRVIKDLRAELKEFKESHEEYLEADKLSKKLKNLRDKINNQTEVRILSEKIATLTERLELLKEIIKVQLIELEQEEIKHDGRKLKLVKVLKEMRDGEES